MVPLPLNSSTVIFIYSVLNQLFSCDSVNNWKHRSVIIYMDHVIIDSFQWMSEIEACEHYVSIVNVDLSSFSGYKIEFNEISRNSITDTLNIFIVENIELLDSAIDKNIFELSYWHPYRNGIIIQSDVDINSTIEFLFKSKMINTVLITPQQLDENQVITIDPYGESNIRSISFENSDIFPDKIKNLNKRLIDISFIEELMFVQLIEDQSGQQNLIGRFGLAIPLIEEYLNCTAYIITNEYYENIITSNEETFVTKTSGLRAMEVFDPNLSRFESISYL